MSELPAGVKAKVVVDLGSLGLEDESIERLGNSISRAVLDEFSRSEKPSLILSGKLLNPGIYGGFIIDDLESLKTVDLGNLSKGTF